MQRRRGEPESRIELLGVDRLARSECGNRDQLHSQPLPLGHERAKRHHRGVAEQRAGREAVGGLVERGARGKRGPCLAGRDVAELFVCICRRVALDAQRPRPADEAEKHDLREPPGQDQRGQPERLRCRLAEAAEDEDGDDRLGADGAAAVPNADEQTTRQRPHAQHQNVQP
jgi:hypothetical protein